MKSSNGTEGMFFKCQGKYWLVPTADALEAKAAVMAKTGCTQDGQIYEIKEVDQSVMDKWRNYLSAASMSTLSSGQPLDVTPWFNFVPPPAPSFD